MGNLSFADINLTLFHLDLPSSSELLETAVRHGWQGNLWHCSITSQLISDENVFSLSCERRRALQDTLYSIAVRDLDAIRSLFFELHNDTLLSDFHHESPKADSFEAIQVSSLAAALAASADAEEMLSHLTTFFTTYGVGRFAFSQVFRAEMDGRDLYLSSAEDPRQVSFSDLVGYDAQKAKLIENTSAFLSGSRANNVLLYGDAGTGKSTSIQALSCEYFSCGLRVIELKKHQFDLIPALYSLLKTRNYRFILFLDDLSFEENEVDYKQLKAAMEGGAEATPDNVLIYATSNRRHLIRETWNDRSDIEHSGDIHRSDTLEEKLSLSGRFGLQIFYPNPTFEEYHTIVRELAQKNPALSSYSDEELWKLSSTWQTRRGSRSGRTAQQFINDLLCRSTTEAASVHSIQD